MVLVIVISVAATGIPVADGIAATGISDGSLDFGLAFSAILTTTHRHSSKANTSTRIMIMRVCVKSEPALDVVFTTSTTVGTGIDVGAGVGAGIGADGAGVVGAGIGIVVGTGVVGEGVGNVGDGVGASVGAWQ